MATFEGTARNDSLSREKMRANGLFRVNKLSIGNTWCEYRRRDEYEFYGFFFFFFYETGKSLSLSRGDNFLIFSIKKLLAKSGALK